MSQSSVRSNVRAGLVAAAFALLPSAEGEARSAQPFGDAPSLSMTFEPAVIAPDRSTLVTITLSNPGPTPATLTAEFDDVLPAPVVIGGGAGATTCPNGIVSAIGGFAVFALNFGAEIPAQGSCIVTACVTADSAGTYTNTLPAGALQTDNGNNADAASAILGVSSDIIFADGLEGACV